MKKEISMRTEKKIQYKLTEFFFQFEWIFQKTSGDQQGVSLKLYCPNKYILCQKAVARIRKGQ